MIDLILTLDYELFGNGSGDVSRDVIEPTSRLLGICDRYGAKLTIFLEVGEYWAMKEAERTGTLCLDYSPSQEIEEQLQRAVRFGHDVQLHLHPWWIGASFEAGRWRLCPQYKRVTDLPNGLGSEDDPLSIVGALTRGRRTLETIIHPVDADYECRAYRAAMFWGQPSGELIAGMKKSGLLADSSVIYGLHETAPVPTDYRRAPSAHGYWWTTSEDISQAGPTGEHILEFPVYSQQKPYVCNFKWTKLRTTLKRRRTEKANMHGHGMMEARRSTESLGSIRQKLTSLQPLKYDFCKLSARDMIRGALRATEADEMSERDSGTPVVMLGHSKDFWNDWNLEAFLKYVKDKGEGRMCFSTLGQVTKRIFARHRTNATGSRPAMDARRLDR